MKYLVLKNIGLYCLIALLFLSCNKSKPKNRISEDNFKSIMTDLFLLQGTYDYLNGSAYNDSAKTMMDSLFNIVYKKHQTDSATFKENWEYLLNNKNNYLSLMKSVRDSIQKLDSIIQLNPDNIDNEIETASYGASMEKELELFEQQFRGRADKQRIKDSILNLKKY